MPVLTSLESRIILIRNLFASIEPTENTMTLTTKLLTAATSILLAIGSSSVLAKTYQHDMGKVTLDNTPERIVVLGFSSLDYLNTLGVAPVGLPKQNIPPYLSQYASDKYANTGGLKEVNYETLFELKPDLIIAEARLGKSYKDLTEIAPTYMLDIDTKDYWASTKQHWQTLGDILDKEQEASQLINNVEKRIEHLNAQVSQQSVKALTVMNSGNNVSMFGPVSRFSFIYQEAGFKASKSQKVSSKPRRHGDLISFEYIADAKPEVLLIMDREQAIGMSTGKAKTLFNNNLVNATPAAKNGQIIYLDPAAWYLAPGGYESTLTMINDLTKAINK